MGIDVERGDEASKETVSEMGFTAVIIADSMSPDGVRLTTFEITFPRIILAEFNTHRVFSRNSASSRAIPVEKMIKRVLDDPYVPSSWGKNQKGMQAGEELGEEARLGAERSWMAARDSAVGHATNMLGFGVHKQLTNRLLEPFMWHTVIVTATEWQNFFHLRNNAQAHPDIQIIAKMMQELYEHRVPRPLNYNEWHLPLISDFEMCVGVADLVEPSEIALSYADQIKVSVGRCARVSYLTHDGKREPQADIELHDRLLASGHLSPFEHVARPAVTVDTHPAECWSGNFRGWVQYRKTIPNEADILAPRST